MTKLYSSKTKELLVFFLMILNIYGCKHTPIMLQSDSEKAMDRRLEQVADNENQLLLLVEHYGRELKTCLEVNSMPALSTEQVVKISNGQYEEIIVQNQETVCMNTVSLMLEVIEAARLKGASSNSIYNSLIEVETPESGNSDMLE